MYGSARARALFAALVNDGEASPEVFTVWAATESGIVKTDVLARGLAMFPRSAEILLAAAKDALAGGRFSDAQPMLSQARVLAPLRLDVWTASFELASRDGTSHSEALLAEADRVIGTDDGLRLNMVLSLTGLVDRIDGILSQTLLHWAEGIVRRQSDGGSHLLKARVHAVREEFGAALGDVQAALADPATTQQAMRLRADLQSYAGSYEQAFTAYKEYLAAYPDDIDAARQLARVFGWAQQYDQARRQYAALLAAHPGDTRLRLEAAAKAAMFDGRWDAARIAYARWLDAEPTNEEAAFEAAQVALAARQPAEALGRLVPLTERVPAHRQSVAALAQWRGNQRASLRPFATSRDSAGEGGRRTLSVTEAGIGAGKWVAGNTRLWMGLRASQLSLSSADRVGQADRISASTLVPVGKYGQLDASVGRFQFQSVATQTVSLGGRVLGNRVSVGSSVIRDVLLENRATIERGMTTTDARVSLELAFPRWSATTMLQRRDVSDNNQAWMVEGSGRLQLAVGRSEWYAFTWLSEEHYRRASDTYFAPGSFGRADVGLEWRRWLSRPRFRDDRDRSLTATYAIGLDSRRYVYHHPAARVAFELGRGVSFEVRGSWLRSQAFRSTDVLFGLRFGGVTPSSPE